ncbi:MAG: hypothetical protein P9M15_00905 [Candidatus Electryoneaceae bacterium]|nr:hypothetical protein [Candidatus Electryoneaceae bacterium]
MSYLTDHDQLITFAGLPSDTDLLGSGFFREHLAGAAGKLKQWIGTSLYDTTLTAINVARAGLEEGENLTEDGGLSEQETRLRMAEAYITLSLSLPALNMHYGSPTIVVSEGNPRGTRTGMSEGMVQKKQKLLIKTAAQFAGDDLSVGHPVTIFSYAVKADGTVDD